MLIAFVLAYAAIGAAVSRQITKWLVVQDSVDLEDVESVAATTVLALLAFLFWPGVAVVAAVGVVVRTWIQDTGTQARP